MHRYFSTALCIAALVLPAAQAAEVAAPPAAADARAQVPEAKYNSAFSGYQPFREQKLAPWRALNDEAHRAGGHIGIFGNAPGARAAPAPHPPEHSK